MPVSAVRLRQRPVACGTRRWRRGLGGLLASVALLGLSGCTQGFPQRPLVLYVAVSTPGEEPITRELSYTFQSRFQQLVQGFRRLHPNVRVQVSLYPEEQLQRQIRRRTRSGLGPDLIVTSANLASALLAAGLTQPMPLDRAETEAIDRSLLRRVATPEGRLAALPLVLYAQLACFDRRRVPQPPADVRQLLQLSSEGVRVGMALQLRSLVWTAGSLGAVPALQAAAQGRAPDAAQRQGLLNWLRWLQSANVQKDVTFMEEEATLREGLRRGRFDWISCGSSNLPVLQRALGDNFGVSTLPDGETSRATPVNPLRVLALGRNSSGEQRQMAIALSRYSLRPLVQRSFTLENLVFLPVNRRLSLPVQSSRQLATLVAARRQGEAVGDLLARLHSADPRVVQLEQVIVALVFGVIEPEQALQDSLRILGGRR